MQTSDSAVHLRDPAEQEDADKNSICGLEISFTSLPQVQYSTVQYSTVQYSTVQFSFTSLPQDIDIKLITEAGEAAAAAE